MIIFGFGSGIFLFVTGLILAWIGNSQNNDLEQQINSYLSTGEVNPGDPFIIVGTVLCIIGALCVIISLFAALVNREQVTTNDRSNVDTKKKKWCPGCGTKLRNDDAFCVQCGMKQVFSQTLSCSVCGAEMNRGNQFCAECGAPVNEGE